MQYYCDPPAVSRERLRGRGQSNTDKTLLLLQAVAVSLVLALCNNILSNHEEIKEHTGRNKYRWILSSSSAPLMHSLSLHCTHSNKQYQILFFWKWRNHSPVSAANNWLLLTETVTSVAVFIFFTCNGNKEEQHTHYQEFKDLKTKLWHNLIFGDTFHSCSNQNAGITSNYGWLALQQTKEVNLKPYQSAVPFQW